MYDKARLSLSRRSYGQLSVQADMKWTELFRQSYIELGCEQEGPTNTSRAWEKIAAIVTVGRKPAKKYGGYVCIQVFQHVLSLIQTLVTLLFSMLFQLRISMFVFHQCFYCML